MEDLQHLLYIIAKTTPTKEAQINNMQLDFKFEVSNNEEYEINDILNSAVYAKKLTTGQLPGLYYLVL